MRIIVDIYNVINDSETERDGKRIYKILNVDLDNYSMVLPDVEYSYMNAALMSKITPETINNCILTENNGKKVLNIIDVPSITTITEEILRLTAQNIGYKAKIENLTQLLDFMRQQNASLITSQFPRKKNAITVDGIYEEIPEIYSAYFKNIRYSSKDLGISIPYVVNGTLTNTYDNTKEEVKRLVSAPIVNNEGIAISTMDIVLTIESYELFKTKINAIDLAEVETGMQNMDTKYTYVASKMSNNAILLTVDVTKLLKYTPIKNGQVDALCHPAVIEDTLYKLNYVTRMIKTYRGGNDILKTHDSLINEASPRDSIYDIPSLGNEAVACNTTIEFYIKGKKAVPSFKKLMNTYLNFDEIESDMLIAVSTGDLSTLKILSNKLKSTLGIPEDYKLDEDDLMKNPNKDAILPLIPYASFLNSIDVKNDFKEKYKENLSRIAELETIREALKARLTHVRYCLNAQGSLPLKQRDNIIIAVGNANHIRL